MKKKEKDEERDEGEMKKAKQNQPSFQFIHVACVEVKQLEGSN